MTQTKQEIDIVKDFFDQALIEKVGSYVNTIFNKNEFKWKTNLIWGSDLNTVNNIYSGTIQQLQIPNLLVPEIIEKFNNLYPQTKNKKFYINYHLFHPLSYIGKHLDQGCVLAATIYLNSEKWDINWGGLFYYKSDNNYKIVLPKFNKAVINVKHTEHGVTSLNIGAPLRKSIQIFVRY